MIKQVRYLRTEKFRIANIIQNFCSPTGEQASFKQLDNACIVLFREGEFDKSAVLDSLGKMSDLSCDQEYSETAEKVLAGKDVETSNEHVLFGGASA